MADLLLSALSRIPSPIVPQVAVDQGFKGHGIHGMRVEIVGRYLPKDLKRLKWMKRRAAIEPLIGHLKNDNGYRRDHLKGVAGDKAAAIFTAVGCNLRQCLRAIALRFASLFGLAEKQLLDLLIALLRLRGAMLQTV